jgi:hypothetical protein
MVMNATMKRMRISEVPITLHKDGRSRPPHLKPWRDGWRHLRFMLIYSPRWLFLVPGMVLVALGAIAAVAIFLQPVSLAGLQFDVGTLTLACMCVIIGVQLVALACFTKVFAISEQLLPEDPRFARVFRIFTLEKGLVAGALLFLVGAVLLIGSIWLWKESGFGQMPYAENVRRIVAAATFLTVGVQVIGSSFFMSVLGLKTTSRKPPET